MTFPGADSSSFLFWLYFSVTMVYILGKSGMHSKWVGNAIVSVMPLEHTKRNRAAKNTQSDRIQFDPFAEAGSSR